jgi:GntR family transcriptional regulator, colanic acid and biofilm gene transcriptional regulator
MNAVPVASSEVDRLEDQAYAALHEALIRGDFAPGEPLPIRGIAAALDTSAMPVRTSLRRLVAEQCLDITPNGTAVVPRLGRAEFAEIVALRSVLEPMAAARAATTIADAELADAEAILRRGSEQRRQGDEGGYQLANYHFHFAIYRAARSPLLLSMIETLWVRRSPVMREAQTYLHARATDKHDELMAALHAHEPERAATILREDIEQGGRFLIERLRFPDDAEHTAGVAALRPLARDGASRRSHGA